MTAPPGTDARLKLIRLLNGAQAAHLLSVVARLGLADTIAECAIVENIAAQYDIDPARMLRLLRGLVAIGVIEEPAPGRFALSAVGALLRTDVDGSLAAWTRLATDATALRSWSALESSLRTGRPGFDVVFGKPVFEYFGADPELAALYNAAMSQQTRDIAAAAAQQYDFGRFRTVIDVGGGNGTLLVEVLQRFPPLTGVVFDTPAGAAQAPNTIAAAGLSGRCAVRTGSFFDAIPAGFQLCLLKWILHDWDDERAVAILRNCRAALPDKGRVLIIEQVLPEPGQPATSYDGYLRDLAMLVLYGGKERSQTEFDRICASAGLVVTNIRELPDHAGTALIEAAPA